MEFECSVSQVVIDEAAVGDPAEVQKRLAIIGGLPALEVTVLDYVGNATVPEIVSPTPIQGRELLPRPVMNRVFDDNGVLLDGEVIDQLFSEEAAPQYQEAPASGDGLGLAAAFIGAGLLSSERRNRVAPRFDRESRR